jgi:hypothetical protein
VNERGALDVDAAPEVTHMTALIAFTLLACVALAATASAQTSVRVRGRKCGVPPSQR